MAHPELICPKTGEQCIYYHFCAAPKENIDEVGYAIHPESLVGEELRSVLPESVVPVFMGQMYCSQERLVELGKLAASEDGPAETRKIEDIAVSLAMNRTLFISDPQNN